MLSRGDVAYFHFSFLPICEVNAASSAPLGVCKALQPYGGKSGVCESEIVFLGQRDTVAVETLQGRLEIGAFAASPALKQVWCL